MPSGVYPRTEDHKKYFFQIGKPGYWMGKRRHLSEEHIRNIGLGHLGQVGYWEGKKRPSHQGKNNPMYGKSTPHGKGAYYKDIWMRSTWEIKIAKWLDKHKIKWLYEPKRFILKDRTYCPDFYLPERNIYWEIKGWFYKRSQETIRQFRELYPEENLLVLTKPIYEAIVKEIRWDTALSQK